MQHDFHYASKSEQMFDVKRNSLRNHITKQGKSGNFVRLMKEELQYLGPADLTQYFVQSYNITDSDDYVMSSTKGRRGIQVDIVFSRRLLNKIITVFLPCMLLCIVSFSTILYGV